VQLGIIALVADVTKLLKQAHAFDLDQDQTKSLKLLYIKINC
jgi:hypothetical protein